MTLLPGVEMAKIGSVCLVTGTLLTVVSAAYPTYVAARMSPVEAMRVEI